MVNTGFVTAADFAKTLHRFAISGFDLNKKYNFWNRGETKMVTANLNGKKIKWNGKVWVYLNNKKVKDTSGNYHNG